MFNVLRKLISDIRLEIPSTILNLAFNPNNKPVSIDNLIIEQIIHNKILLDTNLVAGVTKEIVLIPKYHEYMEHSRDSQFLNFGRYSLYRIPPEVREYRNITKIVKIDYPGNLYEDIEQLSMGGATLNKLSKAVLQSHTLSHRINTPTADVEAGDLIKIIPGSNSHIDFLLTCRLEYDLNFSTLNASAILALSDLVLCATKTYIYVNLITEIDQGRIIHGGEHGVIRDIVTRYENENEKYVELLKKFHGNSLLSTKSKKQLIHYMA